MTKEILGRAPIVRRWSATFPSRKVSFWDCRQWGGGFMRVVNVPGAAVIHDDVLIDFRTGVVYRDPRFATEVSRA